MVSAMQAQVVEQGEPAMVYYSPKTTIALDFTYTVETQERGVFADFAEAMLGITQAVKEDKITYTLQDVRIGTSTSADYSRPHKVVAETDFPLLLSISEKGLLKGYNVPDEASAPRPNKEEKHKEKPHFDTRHMAPYPEEVLKAATSKAQAHAAAQQIFHIRETRMYLINGEVEHAPADGKAMELVLNELDRQERELIELFVGKKHHRTEHKQIMWVPEEKASLWFFSEENGFTDADNIDAEAISVSAILYPQRYAVSSMAEEPKGKKKGGVVASQIVYNLPGSAAVKVLYKGDVLGKRTLPIAQLGIDVPIAKDLFTGNELPVIVVSEKTGNIVSISK